jgi:hypothetical protein
MKLNLLVFCFIVCFIFSCSSKTETSDQPVQDSTASTVAAAPSTPALSYNPADSGTFKGFIDLIQSEGELPEWAVSFISDETVGRFTAKEAYKEDSIHLLLYTQFVPVGPGMDRLQAASFTLDGEIISNIRLGDSYPSSGPDGGGQDFTFTYDTDRNVIYVTNRTTDWDEQKQEEFTIESWNPYYLADDGQIVQGRKYPEISQRILETSSLIRFSKEELKIMRNEIFAVYGYIFKTEPLKSYYNAAPWYIGERENVDDYLSEIEKANVALIKEVENSK